MRPARLLTPRATQPFAAGAVRLGDVEVACSLVESGCGMRLDWCVRNPGRRTVKLDRVGLGIDVDRAVERVLEHGWQSWSVVRRCRPDDVRAQRRRLPAWRRASAFADPVRAGKAVTGEPFLVTDGGVVGFLAGARHLSVVEAAPEGDGVVGWALLDGVPLAAGEERFLDPMWWATGDPGRLYSQYAAAFGVQAGARAATPTPPGWCSWYHYRSAVTPADVLANAGAARAAGLCVIQIDDGYQAGIGDWLTGREAWAQGTAPVAKALLDKGLRPGIWTAPFLVDEGGSVAGDHPGWLCLDRRAGRPVRVMHNPRWWGGWALALDTTHPGVLDHLRETFATLAGQGFDYHKVDFLYAGAVPARRHDSAMTRAQALRAGLEAVRDGIGGGAFLAGCGSPFGPAVGMVDAMRVSTDVAPWWAPRRTRPGMEEAASCARHAVVTSLLRAPLHRRLWANDNDCLLLRGDDTELEPWQRRMVAAAVAGGGGFVMVGDDMTGYGDDERQLLARTLSVLPSADAPLDLVDPFGADLTVRSAAYELVAAADGEAALLSRGDEPGTEEVVIDARAARLRRR
ncbi:MAG: alpha-galactosidase [Actinomycetota bacterium]|nr:alpha-galactosidase [Actinomycetota bacterium]